MMEDVKKMEEVKEEVKLIHTYTGELSNKNAIPNAKKLYAYLKDTYKKKCLTAQHESFWINGTEYEMDLIKQFTGKLPAIRGLDFISNQFEGTTARSKEWWNKGGIVTICWHTGPDFASAFTECLEENLDWENAMTPGTEAYTKLIMGMDRAVPYLRELHEAGVPVLWRPFHEFDGRWFWWGKGGSENFKKLWRMMYDRYTDFWGLNNLIWVLGYSYSAEEKARWYPGDDYVDLLGADNYESGPDVDEELYERCVEVAPAGMPIVYHECGDIPCEEDMRRVPWLFFMPWYDWVLKGNTPEHFYEIYNSDYFVTLDELPNLRSAT